MKIFFYCTVFICFMAHAQHIEKPKRTPFGLVVNMRGASEFNQEAIFNRDTLHQDGIIHTLEGARLKIYFYYAHLMAIMDNGSKIEVKLENGVLHIKQLQGFVRWYVGSRPKTDEINFELQTPNTSITSLGGDFLLSYLPELKETEALVFGKKISFIKLKEHADYTDLGPFEWAGLGGRFTDHIGEKFKFPVKLVKKQEHYYSMHSKLVFGKRDRELFNQIVPF